MQFMWIWLSILVANWRLSYLRTTKTGFGMLDLTILAKQKHLDQAIQLQ